MSPRGHTCTAGLPSPSPLAGPHPSSSLPATLLPLSPGFSLPPSPRAEPQKTSCSGLSEPETQLLPALPLPTTPSPPTPAPPSSFHDQPPTINPGAPCPKPGVQRATVCLRTRRRRPPHWPRLATHQCTGEGGPRMPICTCLSIMRAKPTFPQVPNSVRQGVLVSRPGRHSLLDQVSGPLYCCSKCHLALCYPQTLTYKLEKSPGPRGLTCQGSLRARLALAGRPRVVGGAEAGPRRGRSSGRPLGAEGDVRWAPGNGSREEAGRGLRADARGSRAGQGQPKGRPSTRTLGPAHNPGPRPGPTTPPANRSVRHPPPGRTAPGWTGRARRHGAGSRSAQQPPDACGAAAVSGVGRGRGYGPSDPHRPGPTPGRLRSAGRG